ncbi:MAG: polysaccharide deacetylase family protein [Porticoccaceae bacterium]
MPDFFSTLPRALLSRAIMALSPLGQRQRLSILIYHRVVEERDWMRPAVPTTAEFAWQMHMLKRHFRVIALTDAVGLLREGRLPRRAACVTFDDGYADNLTVALPVLRHYGVPATVFVTAGYLDGGRMWNDTVVEALRHCPGDALDLSRWGLPVYAIAGQISRRRAAHDIIARCKYLDAAPRKEIVDRVAQQTRETLPDDLMLTSLQLLSLHRQGVEIGGHSCSHPILSRLPVERAREDIVRGKRMLEDIIGTPLRLFAYPNGQPLKDYNDEHVAVVKDAGFEAAVTTRWGVADRTSDPYQLPRFTPWDKSSTKFLLRMALNSRHVAEPAGACPC